MLAPDAETLGRRLNPQAWPGLPAVECSEGFAVSVLWVPFCSSVLASTCHPTFITWFVIVQLEKHLRMTEAVSGYQQRQNQARTPEVGSPWAVRGRKCSLMFA